MTYDDISLSQASSKVSIVVPVYNTQNHVEKCLNSLKNQSFKNFEVIIVDDGSTDQSLKVIEPFLEDKRFKLHRQGQNTGTFHARLAGFQLCKGEYIGTIDSDDWVAATFIETLFGIIQNDSADIAECRLWQVNENDALKKVPYSDHKSKHTLEDDIITKVIDRSIWHILANKLFKIALFKENLDFYQKIKKKVVIADDKLLSIPMFASAKHLSSTKKRLYYYKTREDSTSNNRVLEHDIRHIQDTCYVDEQLMFYLYKNNVDKRILEKFQENINQEVRLALKNCSCYKPHSDARIELYKEIISNYRYKLLEALHGSITGKQTNGTFIFDKKAEINNLISHLVFAENSFRFLLKQNYNILYKVYFPISLILRGFKSFIRKRSQRKKA